MKSFVLQTRLLFESHTETNIAEVLKAAIQVWELERAPHSTAVVTDNARNMEVAEREAGLSPYIKFFAHKFNLASQAGLNVSRVTRLLGRVRKVMAFFHRSAAATAVLTEKQKMLEIASHKLIMDVVTRWNSSMDMLERYLEQQAAITAALLSTEVRKNARHLDTVTNGSLEDSIAKTGLLTGMIRNEVNGGALRRQRRVAQGSNGQPMSDVRSPGTAGLWKRHQEAGADGIRRPEDGSLSKDLTMRDSVKGTDIAPVMTLSWSESALITHPQTPAHTYAHTRQSEDGTGNP